MSGSYGKALSFFPLSDLYFEVSVDFSHSFCCSFVRPIPETGWMFCVCETVLELTDF